MLFIVVHVVLQTVVVAIEKLLAAIELSVLRLLNILGHWEYLEVGIHDVSIAIHIDWAVVADDWVLRHFTQLVSVMRLLLLRVIVLVR